MDVSVVLCVWSLVASWLCSAVLSAPTASSPEPSTISISWGPPLPSSSSSSSSSSPSGPPISGPVSRAKLRRTKRCSCSTFLDKECVYFCHLDIIWVNTPERVVSYGLGNAPRTRRALRDPTGATGGGGGTARCRCSRRGDAACHLFCGPGATLSSEAPLDTGTRSLRRSAGTTARPTQHQAAAAAAAAATGASL